MIARDRAARSAPMHTTLRAVGFVLAAAMLSCGERATGAASDSDAPRYLARPSADSVPLRAGPDASYPVTSLLTDSDVLEVYKEAPGQWLAVRPPEGSQSWISSLYLRVLSDDLGQVNTEGAPSYIGDTQGRRHAVVQVRLHRDELVVLQSPRPVVDGEGRRWYRIAPPSGEFRWIHAQHLAPDPVPLHAESKPVEPKEPRTAEMVPPRSETVDDELLQAELDVSAMLLRDPRHWNLSSLTARVEHLREEARQPARRRRAESLLQTLQLAQLARQSADQVAVLRAERNSERSSSRQESPPPVTEHRFDAAGRLARLRSFRVGAPRYALLDDENRVVSAVNPAPGQLLEYYVGRRIGVHGPRTLDGTTGALLVTAKHITELQETVQR